MFYDDADVSYLLVFRFVPRQESRNCSPIFFFLKSAKHRSNSSRLRNIVL